jgi:hypothetical protein
MQLFEKKSFTRLSGLLGLGTYCACAMWTVAVLDKAMPDIPPVLAGTIAILYGINTAKAILPRNGQS